MAEILADDISTDDRRRVVSAGSDTVEMPQIANMRAIADVGVNEHNVDRHRDPRGAPRPRSCPLLGPRPAARGVPHRVLGIVEIDADERIVARVVFDPDDIDAAFEELDARYLAGEAAAHAHTGRSSRGPIAALNRRELPATTADWVNIDHRRVTAFAPGDLTAYIRATWDLAPDVSDLHRGRASAERPRGGRHPCGTWDLTRGLRRRVADDQPVTVEGDLISRCELFDEADLDAALARFDELSPHAPQLENAASRVYERFWTYFAARDWDAHGRDVGRRHFHRRSPTSRERRDPTRSRCRHREHAEPSPKSGQNITSDRHCDPRGAPRPHSCPIRRTATSGPRHSTPSAQHRRDRRRRADRGGASRSTSTTSTPPSRSSMPATSPAKRRPRAHVVGHRGGPTPRSIGTNFPATTPDWVNIDHRRGDSVRAR